MRRRFLSHKSSFDYSDYMTVEALVDGVTVIMPRDVEYNIGKGWVAIESGVRTPPLKKGQYISFKGYLMDGTFGTIQIYGDCSLKGNCMSLIGKSSLHPYVFNRLFMRCPIIEVESGFLPAKILSSNCYNYMFFNCTRLTTAPELPATTLTRGCYSHMFAGCTILNYIKMLATDISETDCLTYWVDGVSSKGTFVRNADMTSLPMGVNGIPKGWVIVNDGEESVGSKTVNHGVLKITSNGNCKIYWEYPVENTIITVVVGTSLGGTTKTNIITTIGYDVSTNNHTLGPGENLTHIESVAPTEDHIYIYEVTIE